VLVEPKYGGNVGSVARVMKNFGFSRLVLVKPPELGSDARANAMHGINVLENAWTTGSLEEVQDKVDFLVATTAKPAGDGNTLRTPVMPWQLENALESEGKVGLVFGREDYGLLNSEIELCDLLVTIPANPEYQTLNIAQAVGVLLYELAKDSMALKLDKKKFRELDGDRKRVLLENIDGVVDVIYDREFENKLAKKTFRQLVGRAFISGREAQTLIGLLRHVREKLEEVR
jgi:tRNA/rRNA methyltransferase